MCGNGGRCIAAFAQHLGLANGFCRFMAIDGEHEANISPRTADACWVELKMLDVQDIEIEGETYVLNTGSPHYVRFVEALDKLDMVAEGRAVRYADRWKANGINVNLVADAPENGHNPITRPLEIRTYERGVEDETFACGTGVTAAAIASFLHRGEEVGHVEIPVFAKGGELAVRFQAKGQGYFTNIWLCGPAVRVFEGNISI
jgi:diaminopimelate epimerase